MDGILVDAALGGVLTVEDVSAAFASIAVSGVAGITYDSLLVADAEVVAYSYDYACALTLTADVSVDIFADFETAIAGVWSEQAGMWNNHPINTVQSALVTRSF